MKSVPNGPPDLRPPKLACWLLRQLGSRNSETMLGDIHEQFVRGKSRLWFWREVGVAIAYSAAQLNRSSIMKRTILSTILLLGVFSLGYWTARSPLVIHEEMPSESQLAVFRGYRASVARQREERKESTVRFLEKAVEDARKEYRENPTAESKATLDLLGANLEAVKKH